MNNIARKPLGYKIWFKVFLTILVFIPPYTRLPYDPAKSTEVIAQSLANPLITSIPWALPIAKVLLLAAVILPLTRVRFSGRVLLGYYAASLIVIGLLQNMAHTEDFGFTWLIGNTLVQLIVSGFCLADAVQNQTIISAGNLRKSRLWVIVLMLLAFLAPYAVSSDGHVYPSFSLTMLTNESGVTYCMVTPVIIGILLLFSGGVHKPTLSIVSYVGLIFGMLNMITWFTLQNKDWWMGVLHLPLFILSFYGLLISRKERYMASDSR